MLREFIKENESSKQPLADSYQLRKLLRKGILLLTSLLLFVKTTTAEQGHGLASGNLLLVLFLVFLGSLAMATAVALLMYYILNRISSAPRRTAWGTVISANLGFVLALIVVIALQTDKNMIIFPVIAAGVYAGGRIGYYYSSPSGKQ